MVYTDGGCSGNWSTNYKDRRMVWVVTDHFGDVISEESDNLGGSNNIAEILAIRDAVKYAVNTKQDAICIKTDSMIALHWITGSGKLGKHINDPERTRKLLQEIKDLSKNIDVFVKWISREDNLAGHYIENKHAL